MPHVSNTPDKERLHSWLKGLAEEISSELSSLEATQSKELLSDFVSDLFLSAAEQQRREERHRRQAEGIAAAKAKGVRFGRAAKPVPNNFDELHQAWRDGELSLQKAADMCGLSRGAFYSRAVRREQGEDSAV